MSIKSAILKRKLKNNSNADAFLMQEIKDIPSQLVANVMELLKEEHNDISAKKQAEFEALVEKNVQGLLRLSEKLEQKLTDTEGVNQREKDEIRELSSELKTSFATYKTECKDHAQKSLDRLDKKLASLFARVDEFRGEKGEAGKDGRNGSPDTPDEVVTKVNSAKKKVNMSAVDGLLERLDSLKTAIRGSKGGKVGGGMGEPQHETKSVGASTTSVTLSYPVGAGGRAIWMFYMGQFLIYGTHYTVNRDVVTLTIDNKVDNTYIDITYIRGS
ncbi:MAG: hypothetical protein NUV78_01120 [Candidatus Zambryskibacteria bacterium]|nr:hypothetical protein [Candidatus Zambryskibacteria bacterium]